MCVFGFEVETCHFTIRHCCKCLYGCPKQARDSETEIELPETKDLFPECEWKPFVSNEAPSPETWDAEDRATALTRGTSGKWIEIRAFPV